MRTLVTGAAGFVGRHLVAHLEAQDDQVHAADRANAPELTDHAGLGLLRGQSAARGRVPPRCPDQRGRLLGGPGRHVPSQRRRDLGSLLACRASRRSAGAGGLVLRRLRRRQADEMPLRETSPTRPVTPTPRRSSPLRRWPIRRGWATGSRSSWRGRSTTPAQGRTPAFVAPALAARVVAAERAGNDEIAVGDLSARREFTDVRDVVVAYRLLVARRPRRRDLQRLLGPRRGHRRLGRVAAGPGDQVAAPGHRPSAGAARRGPRAHRIVREAPAPPPAGRPPLLSTRRSPNSSKRPEPARSAESWLANAPAAQSL